MPSLCQTQVGNKDKMTNKTEQLSLLQDIVSPHLTWWIGSVTLRKMTYKKPILP